MASYNFVIAAVIITLAICSCDCRPDIISDLCEYQSSKPSLCIVALRSDPRSKLPPGQLTYRVLAEIAVDKAIRQSILVADVARKIENDKKKEALEGCAASLDRAHASLDEVKVLLQRVNDKIARENLYSEVSLAWTESYICDSRIPNIPQPLELKLYNDNFRHLADLIRVIVLNIPYVV